MEAELEKSIAVDDRLAKTPEEDKYGRYELNKDYVASEANSKRFTVERERDELKKQVE